MSTRRYGILYSCASAAVSDQLVSGSFTTLAKALGEMQRVLAAQPGLDAAPMVMAYPAAQCLGLDGSTVHEIVRRYWT